MKYYLRLSGSNDFGFIMEGIHELVKGDIPISESDYNKFFDLQSEGKQFKVKDTPTGDTLFDYIEQFTPDHIIMGPTPEERLAALEQLMLEVL